MKKIAILGSTGSIGTQTLDIVREQGDIQVVAMAAGSNISLLEAQMREFRPSLVSVWDEKKAKELRTNTKDLGIKIVSGMEGLLEVSVIPESEILVTAIVGMLGIRPTIAAIKAGKKIALANKETLVTAGHIIIPLAKEYKVPILPVDSEHSAIFQSLQGARDNKISRILLTASGGPFRGRKADELKNIQVEDALKIDPTVFQSAVQVNMSTDDLVDLVKMNLQSSTTSYSSVLGALGYSDYAKPGSIWIYPKSFEAKNRIVDSLNAYNAAMRAQGEEDKVIVFSDTVGTLMSAVTKIVDMVSNVLVAFVAISLAVSSIMIGVITYISVLERRKEIGILRAIGASKHNVSEVFNAETFIIGMCSGVIGVGLCLLLLIPGNMLIHSIAGTTSVTAVLPPKAALVLIVLATLLTILGGLIPARSAAKCNPVTALRSE